MSVAYQHVHSDVPPCSGNAPGTPEALDDLIVAATRRDPAARPRDASAFLAALVGIRSQLGLRRVPVPVPHRRRPRRAPSPARCSRRAAVPTAGRTVPAPAAPGCWPAVRSPRCRRPQPAATAEPPTRRDRSRASRCARPTVALRRLRRRRWLIAILVVLLLGLAAAAGGWWLGGRWAATPGRGRTAPRRRRGDPDPGCRAGAAGDRRTPQRRGRRPGCRSDPAAGTEQLRGSEVDAAGVHRPARGAGDRCRHRRRRRRPPR